MNSLVLKHVSPTLPWDPLPGESRRLRVLMILMLLLAFLIWLIVPHIEIPKVDRAKAEAVPERLARIVLQQKQIPPPPPKPVKKEETKPEEAAPKTEAKPEETKPVEEAAPKPVATDLQKSAARARASKAIQEAGIADALAGLRDMDVGTTAPRTTGLPGQAGNGTGGLITSTEAAGTSRNLITSRAGEGSGAAGAYAGSVSSGFGGGKAGGKGSAGMLGAAGGGNGGQLQAVQSGIAANSASNVNARVGKDGKSHRTSEDIAKTFDQYGGRLNNLYQRALREDPNMQGVVRLKLTVAPDGSVTSCSVESSQLNNPELEAKVVALVKGFNFGAENVEIWSGTHNLNFFQQN